MRFKEARGIVQAAWRRMLGMAADVNMVRFDDLRPGISVDFVKIDIEGDTKYFALQGMENCLRRSANIKVLAEFSPRSMLEAGYRPSQFLGFMANLGFAPYELSGVPIGMESLLQSARVSDAADSDVLRAQMSGKDNLEILACVQDYAREIPYLRAVIANIVFSRKPI
ncbi:MAG TPA: hypothetical protein VNN09_01895 [Candidatus Competibacteraceae bacterium]|nr:hypothetical protein [Candidatus Competibacteraceae bacterium]